MNSNFDYLKKEEKYNEFIDACIEAEKLMNVSYSATSTFARRALELAVKWVYTNDGELTVPYQDNLASLIYNHEFKSLLEPNMIDRLSYIHKLGNKAVHTRRAVKKEEAVLSLRNLFTFTSWIDYCYSLGFDERDFNESILGDNNYYKKTAKEKDELFEVLSQKDKKLSEIMKENSKLRTENKVKRRENQKNRNYKLEEISELETKQSFYEHLPSLSLCNLVDSKDDVNSRMIFSTYPTMMNSIDEVKNKDGKKLFTNGHFDLIIIDESHRSIYKKHQDIFDYFDANLLGLTATPVDEIDRNTYRIFELEDNNPTYAYELEEAIEEGYLVKN